MKKLFLISIIVSVLAVSAFSQNYVDALRYSYLLPEGTARFTSMGGAFTALGGDMSSITLNPASLGVYRKSEFTFTGVYGNMGTTADYFSETSKNFKGNFHFGNIGYVYTLNSGKDKGIANVNFGMSYNRMKNFYNNTIIKGENTNTSLADLFLDFAWGVQPENLDSYYERLAFDTYLIDTVPGTLEYTKATDVPIIQQKIIRSKGGAGEWDFSIGANYAHKLYMGASLNIFSYSYEQEMLHSEYDTRNLTDISNFSFKETLNSEGTGINARIGVIAKPIDLLRIGFSLQTPTSVKIAEEFTTSLTANYDNSSTTYFVEPVDNYGSVMILGTKYKLISPFKMNLGAALVLEKLGIVSADVEYLNYSSTRMREEFQEDYLYYAEQNDTISIALGSVMNLRTGVELRISNGFSVRGGFAFYPSPYSSNELNYNADYSTISAGLGVRDKNFFFDLGTTYTIHKENYNLYSAYNSSNELFDNIATLEQNNLQVMATVGFKF